MNQTDDHASATSQFLFTQLDFGLGTGGDGDAPREEGRDGLEEWRSEREAQLEKLAIAQGLPLGQRVSIELRGGRFIEGRLLLGGGLPPGACRADALLDLRVGSERFHAAEIVACIRLD